MIIVFDLDDTLYNEIDFVKSGLRAVSTLFNNSSDTYNSLMSIFNQYGSGKVFNHYLSTHPSSIKLEDCIEKYQQHYPAIALSSMVEDVLNKLSSSFSLGLLTDGNPVTQKNKFQALGLSAYFDFIVFSGEHQLSKPDQRLFKMFENHYSNNNDFYYIADNLNKDFIAPNQLGWTSIQVKNPVGIYRNAIAKDFQLPKKTISSINELLGIFKI